MCIRDRLNPLNQSSHEMKMLRKNKETFWVRETIYTIIDDSLTKEIFFVFDNITFQKNAEATAKTLAQSCLLYTSPSPRDRTRSRMPSSA